MTTLTRDQLNARLHNGHRLDVRPDGSVWVQLRDERVPNVFIAEMVHKQLVEEVEPGQWALSENERRRLR
jgi:hypothetical protein